MSKQLITPPHVLFEISIPTINRERALGELKAMALTHKCWVKFIENKPDNFIPNYTYLKFDVRADMKIKGDKLRHQEAKRRVEGFHSNLQMALLLQNVSDDVKNTMWGINNDK